MELAGTTEARLGHVVELFTRWVRRLAAEGDLSFPAAATLVRLTLEGPRRLTDLAAAEGVSQPGMTQLVTRLEADGLVTRTPSVSDGRVVLVAATEAGAALVERRRKQRAQALARLLAAADADDRAAVEAALPALTRLAESGLARLTTSSASSSRTRSTS